MSFCQPRFLLNSVCFQQLSWVVYSSLLQTRPSLRCPAFAAARLSSTSSKPVSLKDRLAEIIPKEIENVCINSHLRTGLHNSFDVGEGHSCSTRQKIFWSRSGGPTVWVSNTQLPAIFGFKFNVEVCAVFPLLFGMAPFSMLVRVVSRRSTLCSSLL